MPALFGTVAAPTGVATELARHDSPAAVRAWIATPPPWLIVRTPRGVDATIQVDAGEREAIALAQEMGADRLLMDDAKARRAAVARGLRVVGTLAVLFEASQRGLVDFARALEALRKTTFYVDESVISAVREAGRDVNGGKVLG